MEVETR